MQHTKEELIMQIMKLRRTQIINLLISKERENIKLKQQVKKQKEVIDKLKRYIDGCLELSPIEDRSVTDDVLDKELKYFLKILKEVSE